jgi:copper(I)-binding protein
MRRLVIGVLLGLLPLAARAQMSMPMSGTMSSPATAAISVEKPWMRYLLPNIPAAAYMQLHNTGAAPVVLTSAASPACGMVMLHQSQDDSGMAMMTDVPSLTIPARGSVALAPGGYHLMCMNPVMKTGNQVTVTLSFQGGATLPVTMPVYGPAGAP